MKHIAKCKGVCSDLIAFEIVDGKVHGLKYYGGEPCPGNCKAVGLLSEGRNAKEVSEILAGNTCGPNTTSCADQFSQALARALEAEAAGTCLVEGDIEGKFSEW